MIVNYFNQSKALSQEKINSLHQFKASCQKKKITQINSLLVQGLGQENKINKIMQLILRINWRTKDVKNIYINQLFFSNKGFRQKKLISSSGLKKYINQLFYSDKGFDTIV